MSEEKKCYEIKDETMEQKLALNKTVCKIIETVYLQDLLKSIVSLDKLIIELSPEEFLKVSEMIRDDTEKYHPQIVLQIVRCLNETKYEEYINFVCFNLYYYLFLYKNQDYMVSTELIEELNHLTNPVLNENIKDALYYLIRENIISFTPHSKEEK
jgi:hypothetical protein